MNTNTTVNDLRISDIGKTIRVTSVGISATGKLSGYKVKDVDTFAIYPGKGMKATASGKKIKLDFKGEKLSVPGDAKLEILEDE